MNTLPLPYVYKGTNPETQEFYIGSRWANKVSAKEDLGFEYYTSSKVVKPVFDQFHWEIIAEFETTEEAYDYEQQLIFESWNIEGLINESCFHGKERFRITGHSEETKEKMSKSHKGTSRVPFTDETKEKMSEVAKGKSKSDETKENMSKAKKGEKHPMFGNHHTDETKEEMSKAHKNIPKLTCPHCGKECSPAMAARWHFDNCKKK